MKALLYCNGCIYYRSAGYTGQGDSEEDKIIQFTGRCLRKNERAYIISELECFAIIYTINKFSHYLKGNQFLICTDHQCLQWLTSSCRWNARLTRWALVLQDSQFTIIPIKGRRNWLTDNLSRSPMDMEKEEHIIQYNLQMEDVKEKNRREYL